MRGRPLCASVEGFSLHAAQAVAPRDREALERLLRYGLRAPFAQHRLSLREDGKVLYRLRRPWPNERGATHLVLDPLDLLRRLAALISFPYAHQVRYHGVFANRSRMRPRLPSPPRRLDEFMIEAVPAPTVPSPPTAVAGGQAERSASRGRTPWAQLLRRVLHVDALSCPRCSSSLRSVPMVVLAFLTDPAVLEKILRHLGLPCTPPALAPARQAPWQPTLDPLPTAMQTEIGDPVAGIDASEGTAEDPEKCAPLIRPPP